MTDILKKQFHSPKLFTFCKHNENEVRKFD
jgi:hypothetical protein